MKRQASSRTLLAVVALLTALIVQPGELGSSDTTRRLQVTHWMWTSAPQVTPGDFPTFGIAGRDGRIFAWYGLGQSLLMLPSDIIATALIRTVPALHRRDDLRPILVSYTVSPLVCVLGVLACFKLLLRLGFTEAQSVAGALGLLFGTTFLHYTQNMMENNLLLLLMLTGLRLQYQWLLTGSRKTLITGSFVSGAALLVRLTAALDVAAAALFVLGTLYLSSDRNNLVRRLIEYIKLCSPAYLLFLVLDRAYHYYRFGQCCTNYIQIYGQQQRALHPDLPATFPYNTPFWEGFWGAWISPEKSVLLFDPLLIVLFVVACIAWKRFGPEVKSYIAAMSMLLLMDVCFHARLAFWSGDVAWGDRYVTVPVQMLALFAIPLLLRYKLGIPSVRAAAAIVVAFSVAIQLTSVWMPCWVEYRQMITLGHPTFVIARRFLNITALTTGQRAAGGADRTENAAVAAALPRSVYFYPYILASRANVPRSIAAAVIFIWSILLILLCFVLWRLRATFVGRLTQPFPQEQFDVEQHAF